MEAGATADGAMAGETTADGATVQSVLVAMDFPLFSSMAMVLTEVLMVMMGKLEFKSDQSSSQTKLSKFLLLQ